MNAVYRFLAFCILATLSSGVCQAESTNQSPLEKPEIVERDPFVNPILAGEEHPPGFTYPGSTRSRLPAKKIVCAVPDEAEDDASCDSLMFSPPPVTVTGIVDSEDGRTAILSGDSAARIVKIGDRLGQYRVSRIESKRLTFTIGDKDFHYPLEAE